MLDLLADAMEVPKEKRSALLGRFQHLQRLKLIEGINPGRGKAAEYSAYQVLVFALAFQILQLGMTPERAVQVIKQNEDHIRLAVSLAVNEKGTVSPAMIWFDPATLNRPVDKTGGFDLTEATFDYGGAGSGHDAFRWFFIEGWVQRMVFVSVSGTIWHLINAIESEKPSADSKPKIGILSQSFLGSLAEWFEVSKASHGSP